MPVSPVIIAEIERVLRYPKVQRLISLSEEEIEDLLESLSQDAETISGTLEIHVVADDPSDNMFLSCALEGRADYIVSGDSHLLDLGN